MFEVAGNWLLKSFDNLGQLTLMTGDTLKKSFHTPHLFRRTVEQMYELGIKSLPITIITSSFVGMAFTLQVTKEFLDLGAGEMIGGIVGIAIWRELAPMLTGVVLSGRVGAAIASELGTMKVTEQIDALKTLSQDPIKYLVIPRVIATTLMMPLLVGIADIVGFFSGLLVAYNTGRINPWAYFESAETMLTMHDITGGLIKALIFGFVISILSCYTGMKAQSGAKGVGDNTTKAVVISLVLVFILNYFLSVALYS